MSHSLKSKFVIGLALIAKLIVTLVFFAALPACATRPATFAQQDPQADRKDMQNADETIRNAVRELFTNYPRKA